MKNNRAMQLGVLGWLFVLLSDVPSSAAKAGCSLLSYVNVPEHFLPSLVLGIGLFFIALSSVFLLKNYFIGDIPEKRTAKWFAIAVLTAAFFTVPYNTHDITFYSSAGEAGLKGINAYTGDWQMKNEFFCPVSPGTLNGIMYGPISVFLFKIIFYFGQSNVLWFIILWKALMLLSLLFCASLALKIVELVRGKESKESWYILWLSQPLLLWESVTNGHFDTLMIALVLIGIYLALKRRWWLAMPVLFVGVWVKFLPILLLPWFFLWWYQNLSKTNYKNYLIQLFAGAALSILVTLLSWYSYWDGPKTLATIILQTKWAVSSMFAAFYYTLYGILSHWFGTNIHYFLTRFVHLLLIVFIIFLLYPLIKFVLNIVFKKKEYADEEFLKVIFISMLVFTAVWQKSFWPWYISWLLPFGFMILRRSNVYLYRILSWIGVVPLIFYFFYALDHLWRGVDAANELWFYWVVVLSVWVYPLYQTIKWKKTGYTL